MNGWLTRVSASSRRRRNTPARVGPPPGRRKRGRSHDRRVDCGDRARARGVGPHLRFGLRTLPAFAQGESARERSVSWRRPPGHEPGPLQPRRPPGDVWLLRAYRYLLRAYRYLLRAYRYEWNVRGARLRALRSRGRRAAVQPARRSLRAALDDPDHPPGLLRMGAVFGDEKLTTALLDWLSHHVEILPTRGDSHRTRTRRAFRPGAGILTEK